MTSYAELPRGKMIDSIAAQLSEEMRDKVWEVIGGGDKRGIVVREGPQIASAQEKALLSTGALVRELALVGDRLQYQILHGDGPTGGWVSVKTKNAFLLQTVSSESELVKTLIRRLAMLPPEVRDLQKIDIDRSLDLTAKLYRATGGTIGMSKLDCTFWLQAAKHGQVTAAGDFPAFPNGDPVLASLFSNSSLKPLRRVFPRPPKVGSDELEFARSLDAVDGLLPDAHAVAYFISEQPYGMGKFPDRMDAKYSLYGAVRYGPQATGTLVRGVPAEEGETSTSNHGGATMAVLYDAAMYLTRLSMSGAAMPIKISCTLSKACPLFTTLEIKATFVDFDIANQQCFVKVRMCEGDVLIAHLDAEFTWRPSDGIVRKPLGVFQAKPDLVCPCVDWVPPELAHAHVPRRIAEAPWDAASYKKAAFDETNAMKFPKRCALRQDLTMIRTMQRNGRPPHVRANRPLAGGEFRCDLSYGAGLTPAAMSHAKWHDPKEARFDGKVKFGPQASDAWFLEATPELSMLAHYGMVFAVMDEFAAHLPRLAPGPEVLGLTWRFEAEINRMIPIGQEMQIRTWLPSRKPAVDHPAALLVKADIRSEDDPASFPASVDAEIIIVGSK